MLSVADRETTLAIFENDYLLEPADLEEPIDTDTKFRATEAGTEFLFVTSVTAGWLRQRPAGAIDLDEEAVQPMLELIAGWAPRTLHELAPEPLTVVEASERM